jgi:hypothetical protein
MANSQKDAWQTRIHWVALVAHKAFSNLSFSQSAQREQRE